MAFRLETAALPLAISVMPAPIVFLWDILYLLGLVHTSHFVGSAVRLYSVKLPQTAALPLT